jgi:hypothetical protein
MSTSPPPQPAVSSSSLRIYGEHLTTKLSRAQSSNFLFPIDIELQYEAAIKVKRAELHIGSQRYKLRRQEGRLGILRKEFTPALCVSSRISALSPQLIGTESHPYPSTFSCR